ncbi:hypothetical protein [Undibacterium sp.]|uniref:hypothetical protein n=1 Tax=Undibacterium sp. TaxID=1914977 RepID=UPI00374D7955
MVSRIKCINECVNARVKNNPGRNIAFPAFYGVSNRYNYFMKVALGAFGAMGGAGVGAGVGAFVHLFDACHHFVILFMHDGDTLPITP